MILQFVPRTHRANPEDNRLWTSRVPTLQFLAAGYISEEESATMHHLPTNPDTEEMDCLRKKCYQIEVHYEMPMYRWCGNLWNKKHVRIPGFAPFSVKILVFWTTAEHNTYKSAYQTCTHVTHKKFWC